MIRILLYFFSCLSIISGCIGCYYAGTESFLVLYYMMMPVAGILTFTVANDTYKYSSKILAIACNAFVIVLYILILREFDKSTFGYFDLLVYAPFGACFILLFISLLQQYYRS